MEHTVSIGSRHDRLLMPLSGEAAIVMLDSETHFRIDGTAKMPHHLIALSYIEYPILEDV